MLDLIGPEYLQRALVEVLLLAILAGLLGTWVVLRRLAFFAHAAGSATLPGLVVAGPLGIAPPLAGLAAAGVFAAGVEGLSRRARLGTDAATGLLLTGALALGVILASDVYETGAGLDRLLFGSLLAVSWGDVLVTAAVAAVAVLAEVALGRRWLARAFDAEGAAALGARGPWPDRALLLLIAAAVVVSVGAVGALLVAAVLVIPAATVLLVAPSVARLRWGTAALAAAEGVAALVAARALNVGPGAALATIGGLVFAAVALAARGRGT